MNDSEFRQWYNSRITGIEVSRDGRVRRRYGPKSSYPNKVRRLPVHKDIDGYPYVRANNAILPVDFLVATCFCQNPNRLPFLIHRDRIKQNCDASNLQWCSAFVFNRWHGFTDWGYAGNGFRVSKAGEVELSGDFLTPITYDHDRNLALDIPREPYVAKGAFNQYEYAVDKLVAAAWLKYPDQTDGILEPALLHIDGDYRNCRLDNLKWVERDSKEYQDYLARKTKDLEAEKIRLNPKLKQ